MTNCILCQHCTVEIENDDGIWYHVGSMQTRCDGPDDEDGIGWGDLVRQAEPDRESENFAHVLTEEERDFIEQNVYICFEEGTTVREALIASIDGAIWAQLEEPGDTFRALVHDMQVDSDLADALFVKVSAAVSAAIRSVMENI